LPYVTAPLYDVPDEALASSSASELVHMLVRLDDRAPRKLIDECARRGDAILDELAAVLQKDYYWSDDETSGEWWLRLHAVMILGLMSQERAGELLVRYMRRIADIGDDNLLDWLAGCWPAFFRNKPASVMAATRTLAEDRGVDAYMRVEAANAVIAHAQTSGALEGALAWAAEIAFVEDEDYDTRVLAGNTLLDFARPGYRTALEALADLQPHIGRMFGRKEIEEVYASGGETPEWEQAQFADPWVFYTPTEIAKRQIRWAEEAIREEEALLEAERGEPYVREAPKIGRNDPCPCGSGKKYKKCCMPQT
jgi:hypothetical protein